MKKDEILHYADHIARQVFNLPDFYSDEKGASNSMTFISLVSLKMLLDGKNPEDEWDKLFKKIFGNDYLNRNDLDIQIVNASLKSNGTQSALRLRIQELSAELEQKRRELETFRKNNIPTDKYMALQKQLKEANEKLDKYAEVVQAYKELKQIFSNEIQKLSSSIRGFSEYIDARKL